MYAPVTGQTSCSITDALDEYMLREEVLVAAVLAVAVEHAVIVLGR